MASDFNLIDEDAVELLELLFRYALDAGTAHVEDMKVSDLVKDLHESLDPPYLKKVDPQWLEMWKGI